MRNSENTNNSLRITVRAPVQVGQALKRWRMKKGLTQAELAKKAGLTQKTVSLAESGSKSLKLMTLFAICAALDLEIKIKERPTKIAEDWAKEIFG